MPFSKKQLIPAGFIVLLISLWATVARFAWVDPIILPSPAKVLSAFPTLFTHEGFARDLLRTLGRVGVALAVAATVGIPLGLYFGYRRSVYQVFETPLHWLRSVPASALFPLFLIVVGVGEKAVIALAAYPSLLVIVVNTVGGAALANKRRVHQAQTLGLGTFAMLSEVLLYEALPHIFNGIRIASSYALVLVVAVEMFIGVGDSGLGRKIYDYQAAYRIPETYAAIITAGVVGVSLNWIITLLERRFLRWLPDAHEEP